MGEQQKPKSAEDAFDVLFLAANTDDLFEWEKLHSKVRGEPPAISERERCDLMIRAANEGALTAQEWNQIVGITIFRTRSLSGAEPANARRIRLPHDRLAWLRTWLNVTVNGPASDRVKLKAIAAKETSERVLIIPTWQPNRQRKDRVVARDLMSALAFGIWLFSDTALEFGGALCRCNYSKCGKFFWKRDQKGRGRPSRKFCIEHVDVGALEAAQQRMAENRKHK